MVADRIVTLESGRIVRIDGAPETPPPGGTGHSAAGQGAAGQGAAGQGVQPVQLSLPADQLEEALALLQRSGIAAEARATRSEWLSDTPQESGR